MPPEAATAYLLGGWIATLEWLRAAGLAGNLYRCIECDGAGFTAEDGDINGPAARICSGCGGRGLYGA